MMQRTSPTPKEYVHRNLNRTCWSVLQRGKLQGYRYNMTLRDVEFRVRPGGHNRAVREGRRNVHAFAVGTPSLGIPNKKASLIRYDVKKGSFVTFQGRAVLGAAFARFGPDNFFRAYGVKYALID